MARATATIRQLKNKDTGIDLSITSVKEVKALIGSAFEYEITVVSNLACFKNAKHKESDNVQFTVFKKFNDFEEIHLKLNTKYTGTVFPQLPKKVIKVSGQVAKERRSELDHFLKFLAMTDKLSSCPLLLEFLGVSAVKANNFRKPDNIPNPDENSKGKENITETDGANVEEDLFEDGNTDQTVNDDEDIFADPDLNIETQDDTKLFEDQDLGGALVDDEDTDLFVPEARSGGPGQTASSTEREANDDLLNIEDDLEDLVKLGTKSTNRKVEEGADADSEQYSKSAMSAKADLQTSRQGDNVKLDRLNEDESTIKQKQNLPQKPKPVLPKKPGDNLKPSISNKPELKQKPSLAAKPELKPKPGTNSNNKVDKPTETESGASVENLNEDDILKYIQENNANNDDDLDLFS